MNYLLPLHLIMMLELHNVTIGELVKGLSATLDEGQIIGLQGRGKTTLLRAIVGLIPIDGGHICIDGEVLTPESAPYFRRYMAYVPQRLSVPEGYDKVPTDYVQLVQRAVDSGKQLLVVDEPAEALTEERQQAVGRMLIEAVQQGRSVLTVLNPLNDNYIQL
jgi:ABC-type cobalamin/Fe3+-siderophores transport system ATPase subunit